MSQPAKKGTQKLAKRASATGAKVRGFTEEERAAMKARAHELKAEARVDKNKAAGEKRRARKDRRDAGTGSRHGQAASRNH
jgi:hypothetical protein